MMGRAIAMVTSSTKFARYSAMRFVKHFTVSLTFYLLRKHAHLKTLSILQFILNFSLDTFDTLVQVSYAQDKSACVSFNFPHFTQKAYIYSIHISGEEINDINLVENLASGEADAPIYSKLGFSYGKAVRFKKEFGSKEKSHNSARPSSPAAKPTMAAISTYTPEMRQLYLSK